VKDFSRLQRNIILIFPRANVMNRYQYNIKDLQNFAQSNNGTCLSTAYTGNRVKYEWLCPIHGRFVREWKYMKQYDSFCPTCAMANSKKTTYEMKDLHKYAEAHNGMCNSIKYINTHTVYSWTCLKHGVFEKSWRNIMLRDNFCYECCIEEQRGYDIDVIQQWIEEKYHGKCLSDEYISLHDKLIFKCSKGHIWETSWSTIYYGGAWCPSCAYPSEQKFRDVIEEVLKEDFPSQKVDWIRNPETGYPLELDGYNKKLGIAFEYQGRQHFEIIDCFGGEKKLRTQQKRDAIKKQACQKNGITLLCPTYELNPKDYKEWIKEQLGL